MSFSILFFHVFGMMNDNFRNLYLATIRDLSTHQNFLKKYAKHLKTLKCQSGMKGVTGILSEFWKCYKFSKTPSFFHIYNVDIALSITTTICSIGCLNMKETMTIPSQIPSFYRLQGKVMFSEACVILFTVGGSASGGGCMSSRGGGLHPGGRGSASRGRVGRPLGSDIKWWSLQRSVRILLECILVKVFFAQV